MESRLGHDLSDVRIHSGSDAAIAASSLSARAFTLGKDVVFGENQYSPETSAGQQLLAHELAHVVQQAAGGVSRVQRAPGDPSGSSGVAPVRSFGLVFSEFNWARYNAGSAGTGDPEKAKPLARELMTTHATTKEWLDNAVSIATWAQENGLPDVRDDMLGKAERAWMVEFISEEKGAILTAGGVSSFVNGPELLVRAAEAAARTGDHASAFAFFGRAHLFYSLQIIRLTEDRESAVHRQSRFTTRVFSYRDAQHVYDALRGIYGFYFQLEKEAQDAGDTKVAADMRARATTLRTELRDRWSFGLPSMIAEVTQVETPRGPGLRLHGANDAETDLTALPGLPSPKEVGNNIQIQDLGKVQEALAGQAEFLAGLARVPAVQTEFAGKAIDMKDVSHRLRVWKAMYGHFKNSGAAPLASLMGLIGRYLEAFTIHTWYNVRDWGKSYLESDMPTDLAGRAERDCGVYALTIAWETFKTLKDADPGAKVEFRLVALLDHVTLVIEDKAKAEFYLLNNNELSGPDKGNPLEKIGKIWSKIRGRIFTAGPAQEVAVGSTADQASDFKQNIWKKYLTNVDIRLRATVPVETIQELDALKKADPAAHAARIAQLSISTYETFYANLDLLDADSHRLDALLDRIVASATPDDALRKAMPELGPAGVALGILLLSLSPPILKADASGKLVGVFSRTNKDHPIARVAMAMLRFQALGGTLTSDQVSFIQFVDRVPLFHTALDDFRKKGTPSRF